MLVTHFLGLEFRGNVLYVAMISFFFEFSEYTKNWRIRSMDVFFDFKETNAKVDVQKYRSRLVYYQVCN